MAEFQIGTNTYRSSRLNALQQFHVVRKLAPIIAQLGPALTGVNTETNQLEQSNITNVNGLGELVGKLEPVLHALAEMSETDCDYVLQTCLAVVQRKQGEFWTSVWNISAKRFMFEDLQLPELIQLTMQIIQENLTNFFPEAQSASQGPALSPSGQSIGYPYTKG